MIRAVYGAGGCGRGIMPLVREQYSGDDCIFVDDGVQLDKVNGMRVVSFESFISSEPTEKQIVIAIAHSPTRRRIVRACQSAGLRFYQVRAKNVVEMDDVEIGEGALISPFVTFTSNIRIGVHFHANLYSYVEHDCVIGDFVTLAPGAKVNGNVIIQDGAYIGSGAVIKNGVPGNPLVIGEGAIVGMGAVVTKNVLAGSTVIGNPARPI